MKLFIFNESRPVVLLMGRLIRLEPKGYPGDHKEITPEQSRHPHVVEFLRLGKVSVLTEEEAKVRLKPAPAPAPKKVSPPKEPEKPKVEEKPVEPVKEEVPPEEEAPPAESNESFTLDDEPTSEEPVFSKGKKEKSLKKRKGKKR